MTIREYVRQRVNLIWGIRALWVIVLGLCYLVFHRSLAFLTVLDRLLLALIPLFVTDLGVMFTTFCPCCDRNIVPTVEGAVWRGMHTLPSACPECLTSIDEPLRF